LSTNLSKYATDLERLDKRASELYCSLNPEATPKGKTEKERTVSKVNFIVHYQAWYTEAHEVVRQLLPRRLEDFQRFLLHREAKGHHL